MEDATNIVESTTTNTDPTLDKSRVQKIKTSMGNAASAVVSGTKTLGKGMITAAKTLKNKVWKPVVMCDNSNCPLIIDFHLFIEKHLDKYIISGYSPSDTHPNIPLAFMQTIQSSFNLYHAHNKYVKSFNNDIKNKCIADTYAPNSNTDKMKMETMFDNIDDILRRIAITKIITNIPKYPSLKKYFDFNKIKKDHPNLFMNGGGKTRRRKMQ